MSYPLPSLWISHFLSKPENSFLCAVDITFIRDGFNMIGLEDQVPCYAQALRAVLNEPDGGVNMSGSLSSVTDPLYGLAHARYIMTPRGVTKMLEKYAAGCFGHCPRVLCEGSAVLPIGLDDIAGLNTVRLYCPRCMDICVPPYGAMGTTVDGAYFGTGFPHMAFMNRPEYRPSRPKTRYVPKIYGFTIHKSARDLQRIKDTTNKHDFETTPALPLSLTNRNPNTRTCVAMDATNVRLTKRRNF